MSVPVTANNEDVRLAAIVITWNIMQHFYPYFDIVDVNWQKELKHSFQKAFEDKNEKDFLTTLRIMLEKLKDGHAQVFHPLCYEWRYLPFAVDYINNKVVVINTKRNCVVRKGDIILKIDGINAHDILIGERKYISGSKQWKQVKALETFGYGDNGIIVINLKRGKQVLKLQVKRNQRSPFPSLATNSIQILKPGIYYVNLMNTPMPLLLKRINELAQAKGIIFDARGYPARNHPIIRHMIDKTVLSPRWNKPLIIYPDQENIVGYDSSGRWQIEPASPKLTGKLIFLTDARAISYAEAFLGIVEHYRLAEIIGRPTAGCNGNVNALKLPGNFTVTWTGMKVIKHDLSQHHLIGIQPTIFVKWSLQDVITGQDSDIKKALQLLNEK